MLIQNFGKHQGTGAAVLRRTRFIFENRYSPFKTFVPSLDLHSLGFVTGSDLFNGREVGGCAQVCNGFSFVPEGPHGL